MQPIEIESANKCIGDIPVFFFENDTAGTSDDFVTELGKLVDKYSETDGIYVVICTTEEGSDLDRQLSNKFGSHYIQNGVFAGEMTEMSYNELAQKVCQNLDEQGCFDEVKEKIEKATNDI